MMCGIVGYVSKKEYSAELILKMANSITYRGPNGTGHYKNVNDKNHIAIAHNRLAILDLSNAGKQPMINQNKDILVSYNGEIYNYLEIREELVEKGYLFESDCDTEVLLYAYEEWGIESVSRFNGMFAYCIYDKRSNEIFLVRDRVGKKPLYYYKTQNDFCFASELKPFYYYPNFKKVIDKQVLHSFLWNAYIPAPYTIFENTYKLEPGHYLKFKCSDYSIENRTYWEIETKISSYKLVDENEQEQISNLKNQIIDSVEKRMVADVPVGILLSGGIDSTLVASVAKKELGKNIETFSIGFYDQGFNEANEAKKIAQYLGTKHHEKYIKIEDAYNYINKIPSAFSEPFADNSQIPTMILSEFIKQHVTVALSGDGGDELFCGYPHYNMYSQLNDCAKFINFINPIFKNLPRGNEKFWKFEKLLNASSMENVANLDYITAKPLLDRMIGNKYEILDVFYNTISNKSDFKSNIMARDIKMNMSEGILAKSDRASMFYSVELRAPLLDYRIVEQSLSMPIGLKCKNGILKYPLKKILEDYIPRELIDRPKKGFGIPINKWLHEDFEKIIDKYFDEKYLYEQGIFCIPEMYLFYVNFKSRKSIVYDRIMWTIIMFQLWYDEYIKKEFI